MLSMMKQLLRRYQEKLHPEVPEEPEQGEGVEGMELNVGEIDY